MFPFPSSGNYTLKFTPFSILSRRSDSLQRNGWEKQGSLFGQDTIALYSEILANVTSRGHWAMTDWFSTLPQEKLPSSSKKPNIQLFLPFQYLSNIIQPIVHEILILFQIKHIFDAEIEEVLGLIWLKYPYFPFIHSFIHSYTYGMLTKCYKFINVLK